MRRSVCAFLTILVLISFPQRAHAFLFDMADIANLMKDIATAISNIDDAFKDLIEDIGDILTEKVRPTCDEAFWEVLKNRAWEGAHRDITQNENLIAKPDSILTYSCFDSFMNKLANEAEDNYPGEPNESFSNSFLGLGNDIYEVARDVSNLILEAADDPILKNRTVELVSTMAELVGYKDKLSGTNELINLHMESALEILILDTLVNNVSNLQYLMDSSAKEKAFLLACGRMHYYEVSNFFGAGFNKFLPNFDHSKLLLGGRSPGDYGGSSFPFNNHVNPGQYECGRMQAVWMEAKCYDYNREFGHDGFYPFENQQNSEIPVRNAPAPPLSDYLQNGKYVSADDKRTHFGACPAPSNLSKLLFIRGGGSIDEFGGALCDYWFHGQSAVLGIGFIWLLPGPDALKWDTAHTAANPTPGGAGAIDAYKTLKELYDPSLCSTYTPLKTGVVVTRKDGTTYDDAYCMAPGCWYYPEVSEVECQPF